MPNERTKEENRDVTNREDREQGHAHRHGSAAHHHSHGAVDPTVIASEHGLWAVKWSFVVLAITAGLQLVVVVLSSSVALLADAIHNLGDAATAIPLAIAFLLARRGPSGRFTFGYGRAEDLAGAAIVVIILASAILAGYQSIDRLLHPRAVAHLGAVAVAAIIGFLGNEGVAIFRIRVGRQIASAALIADGYHARIDGWTSLAVLAGAAGIRLGYPIADPVAGLAVSIAILGIVIQSGKLVFTRLLDGVDPGVIEEIRHVARHVSAVHDVSSVRARWCGHELHAELAIAVDGSTTVERAHDVAAEVVRCLQNHQGFLFRTIIRAEPANQREVWRGH